MCGGRWLDGRIMIKASFLLVKALRSPRNAQLALTIYKRTRSTWKNIYCSITAEKPPSRGLGQFTVFCVANGLVLIIDSVGVSSSHCYKYFNFISSPSTRSPNRRCSPFPIALLRCLSFGDLSAWNNVAVLVKQFLRVSFVVCVEQNSREPKQKILAFRSSRRKALKHFFRVGHLIHTIIIFALASLNENSF